jgi:hypothetical protein
MMDRQFCNLDVRGWEGYDPNKVKGLYPNEQAADFAFLTFGGGQRKCVGDQFARMELTVSIFNKEKGWKAKQPWERMCSLWFSFFLQVILLNNYVFTLATSVDDVGMKTGATIHTSNMNGLNMYSQKICQDADPPKTDEWWVKQQLKCGLSENVRPYPTEEDTV